MTINPPRILLNLRPDAQPVEVTQQEYDETRDRICSQHPEMGAGELDEHIDFVLCTIARPGKTMPPGSLTDPTQVANAFLTDSAHTREVFRGVTALHIDEAKAIQAVVADGTLTLQSAIESAVAAVAARADRSDEQVMSAADRLAAELRDLTGETKDSSAQLAAELQSAAKSISDAIGVVVVDLSGHAARYSKDLCDVILAASDAAKQDADARHKLSARDRWIQTAIIAAGLFAIAGAVLRVVVP